MIRSEENVINSKENRGESDWDSNKVRMRTIYIGGRKVKLRCKLFGHKWQFPSHLIVPANIGNSLQFVLSRAIELSDYKCKNCGKTKRK